MNVRDNISCLVRKASIILGILISKTVYGLATLMFTLSVAYAEVKMVTSEIAPQHHDIIFSSQGFIKAGQQTEISAQVAGRVVELGKGFEPGGDVKKGDLLFSIESSDYRALLATAQQKLADAELALEDEKARSRRAKRNWSKTNTGKPSELVGRDLHVAAARARYNAEKINVIKAKKDLERTNITAPYDGVVQRRDISLGTFVQVGSAAGLLFQNNSAVIDLPILPRYLQHITDLGRLNINLHTLDGTLTDDIAWIARATAFSPALQEKDQRVLLRAHVVLSDTDNMPVFINQYMVAKITIPNNQLLFAIPESAFTQRGSILSLEDGVLNEVYPEVVYQYNGKKYSKLSTNESINVVTESPDLFWSGAKTESLASTTE